MFKKGQIVQSVKYGDYYVVRTNTVGGLLSCTPLTPKF